ncbi:MAG: flagellar motor switch protein FliN [Gammaproteobacteria bacterium]|nr:flagellar motor switch protein FliN [Gammaproteobacteria bacterium]
MNDKRSDAKTIDDEWAAILGDSHPDYADSSRHTRVEDSGYHEENNGVARQNIEKACLDVILDIPVTLSLEVGKSKISIRELLKLNQGSVVELDRLAGEPLDVMVNGTLIAHGEVVVTNDKYGIRLTDVISATERIQKLK